MFFFLYLLYPPDLTRHKVSLKRSSNLKFDMSWFFLMTMYVCYSVKVRSFSFRLFLCVWAGLWWLPWKRHVSRDVVEDHRERKGVGESVGGEGGSRVGVAEGLLWRRREDHRLLVWSVASELLKCAWSVSMRVYICTFAFVSVGEGGGHINCGRCNVGKAEFILSFLCNETNFWCLTQTLVSDHND